jgi:putative hydrolase of the HAD superfamily
MYRNYIFDLYGTLVDISTNEAKAEFWRRLAIFYSYNGAIYTPRELKKNYQNEVSSMLKLKTTTEFPDIQIEKVFQKLYEEKNIIVSKEIVIQTARLFRNLSTCRIELYNGVKETLEILKAKGKKVYILSNGQREFSIPELKYFGIYDYFDRICCSSDIEICKPDERFYQYIINSENLNIKESIMIGNDHLADIEGANRIGMDALYLHTKYSRDIEVEMVDSRFKIKDGDFRKLKEMIID